MRDFSSHGNDGQGRADGDSMTYTIRQAAYFIAGLFLIMPALVVWGLYLMVMAADSVTDKIARRVSWLEATAVSASILHTYWVLWLTFARWCGLLRYGNPILHRFEWTLIADVDSHGYTSRIWVERLDRMKWFPEEAP